MLPLQVLESAGYSAAVGKAAPDQEGRSTQVADEARGEDTGTAAAQAVSESGQAVKDESSALPRSLLNDAVYRLQTHMDTQVRVACRRGQVILSVHTCDQGS